MLKLCNAYGISCDYILTGNVTDKEVLLIDKRVRDLPPDAFFHYERMTDHFLAAIKDCGGSVTKGEGKS